MHVAPHVVASLSAFVRRTPTQWEFHLYTQFEESLSVSCLEEWVTRLNVEAEYERLKHT
jgi:hypothetical protein